MNNRQTTKRYLPLLWLCLVALLMSCGTMRKASSSQKTPAEEQKDPLTPEQRRKYDYFFLEALRMKEKGDLDAAFEMYSHCLDIYPQGAATLYEIAKFYMFLNQPDKGERALKEAVAADPNNYWYNQTLAAYYQNKGEAAKAIYVYEDMVSHFPKRLEPGEDEDEKGGGRLILVLTTILIIAIWMGIIGILIKTDVGGFGSTVLYPLLKDVPYVNKILPQPEETVEQTEGTEHQYGSLSEAISQIKELEKELDEASSTNKNDKKKIKDLKAQIKDLSKYKEDEAAFEKEKEKYYEEVVFSDQAPDIQQYKTYYESIDPENAEVLYKQVVEQITYDSQVEDYAKTYSNMKPQEAASIFDTMTDNLGLVADILMNMGTQQRADILGKMDATTAAKLTEIMEPSKKK